MNTSKISLFAVLAFLTLSSCSSRLSPFTQQLKSEFNWDENDLQRIQYYLSEDVVLFRSITEEESRITQGKIRIKDGRKVEEIIFKKGTPGVLLFSPKNDRFAVSFEEGDRYLMFGPNKKYGGRYVLLAKDWDRNRGQVTYDGRLYRVSSESAYAALMVDVRAARKLQKKSRQASGRTIND